VTTPTSPDESPRTEKGERTRIQILDAALSLFLERGYEGTTMRAIAQRAGASLGNAYYYFRSKEHLIQAFYERTHHEHLAACGDILDTERDFETRLLGVMRAKLNTIMPYHRFSGVLFKTAADPESPLNPFSDLSQPVRRESTGVFAEVVRGSDLPVPDEIAATLPEMLWLYHMGVVLYWIHDTSPACERSYRLVERSAGLIAVMVRTASNPLMRPLTRRVLSLLEAVGVEVRDIDAPQPDAPRPGDPE